MKKTEEAMNMKYGDPENALACIMPFRRTQFNARHDGYSSQYRSLFSNHSRFPQENK
ncbi:MAG: hypothetical protein MZV63_20095 [Marinilabiliales bacterium]|nr:hypothetical protein [Marinilabiliales bacterium]